MVDSEGILSKRRATARLKQFLNTEGTLTVQASERQHWHCKSERLYGCDHKTYTHGSDLVMVIHGGRSSLLVRGATESAFVVLLDLRSDPFLASLLTKTALCIS